MLKFVVGLLALSAAVPSALAAITITGPSSQAYWVANTSNVISWNYASGDPDPISIVVTNENTTTLNGAFSIAEFVSVSAQTFTVTNVTLKTGSGYVVNFVNGSNPSQVYASSEGFEVKPGGTAPYGSSVVTISGSVSTSLPASSRTSSSSAAASSSAASNGALSAYNLPNAGLTSVVGIMGAVVGALLCTV
ncbi:hypothetical protein FRC03_008133 [Tulasnella sp. 419]|nr:hypothetical protein FRC03_008133 [Tulasnella sp. 419]